MSRPGNAFVLFAAFVVYSAWNAASVIASELPLFVARIDADCVADTVFGVEAGDPGFLPSSIRFGHSPACDAEGPNNSAPLEFAYPAWSNLSGSVTLFDVNGDSLRDVVLFLRGRSPGASRDSTRELIVFGQHALRHVGRIDLGRVGRGLCSDPIVTLDLRDADLLTEPAVRDLTGRLSRVWGRLELAIRDRPPTSGIVGEPPTLWSKVYPNPAVYATTVEVASVPPGEYTVALVGLDGKQLMSRSVTVFDEESLLSRLSLESVPAGYYLVTVQRDEALIGRWPVLIVR